MSLQFLTQGEEPSARAYFKIQNQIYIQKNKIKFASPQMLARIHLNCWPLDLYQNFLARAFHARNQRVQQQPHYRY